MITHDSSLCKYYSYCLYGLYYSVFTKRCSICGWKYSPKHKTSIPLVHLDSGNSKTCTLRYNLKIWYYCNQNIFSNAESWWKCFLNFSNCVRRGNHHAENYRNMVAYLVQYKAVGCNISLRVHFMDSHWDFLPENLEAVSNDHKQRFHQDISTTEKRYQGKWSTSMLADYCWTLRGNVPQAKYTGESSTITF